MSDTPRTDALREVIIGQYKNDDLTGNGLGNILSALTDIETLESERDEARDKIERQAERIRYLEGATNHATGTPLSVALRERDALQEQLDAALMLGKMQERRHARELEQVREQYRLSSVCRKLLEENKQLKGEQP